tara:strand:- start:952 stop:2187 length:1236 start_codon:yes stop_codon:yes gene_type:complete
MTRARTRASREYEQQANMRIDPEQNYNEVLNQFQAEIDAQNSIYADRLRQAQQQGQSRLGSGTAVQARRGLLGSDFGAAQTQQVQGYNTGIENDVRREQAAKIAEIMGLARGESSKRIAEKRAAKEAGLEKWLELTANEGVRRETSASKAAKALLAQGVDIANVSPQQLQEMATGFGVSVDAIRNAYASEKGAAEAAAAEADLKTRKAEAEINKYTTDQANIDRTFAENKRQFGAEYALKQRNQTLSEQKAASEGAAASGDPQQAKAKIDLVAGAIAEATRLSNASGNTGVMGKAGRFLGGADDYTNLTAQTNTIRTNVLSLMTDPSIKKFFGPQMSDADVRLMTSAGTTLNPELQSPEALKSELTRLNDLIQRMATAVPGSISNAGPQEPQSFTLPSGQVVNLQPDGTYQ